MALTAPPTTEGRTGRAEEAAAALLGFAAAATALDGSLYPLGSWSPVALGLVVLLGVALLARPALPRGPAAVAVGAASGLWLWSLASTLWAESVDQALVASGRWLLYAALLALLVLVIRNERGQRALLAGAAAGVLLLAGYLLVRLLAGTAGELFLANRLNDPLGYVNGQANLLMLGMWPLLVFAERTASRPRAAAAIGGVVLLAGPLALADTRSAIPVLALVGVLLLAIAPGRLRRLGVWAAALLGSALPVVAASRAPIGRDFPPAGDLRTVTLLTFAGAALAALAWWAGDALLAARPRLAAGVRRAAPAALGGLAVLAAIGALVAVGNPVDRADQAWKDFKSDSITGTRGLAQTGGTRYEYWRVSLNSFAANPLEGIGAGNFDVDYYRARRGGADDTRQPHSIVFQLMAELGIVGLGLLLALVGAVALALWRRRAEAGWAALAAGGVFFTWLFHTSIDWMHVIPGLTGVALCGAAALVAPWKRAVALERPVARLGAVVGVLAVLGLAVATTGRVALADTYRADAEDALGADPHAALKDADDAIDLNGGGMAAYYLKAAALAQLNDYEGARAALLEATRREPHDFVPWQLLGDLDMRKYAATADPRYPRLAKADYGRARDLNPRDPEIATLAKYPSLGLPKNR